MLLTGVELDKWLTSRHQVDTVVEGIGKFRLATQPINYADYKGSTGYVSTS